VNDSSSSVSFLSHRQAEFALVAELGRLRAAAAGLALEDLAGRIEEARSSIESHHFSIAVVGEFKRGKSTFINALLGKEILPADIVPTSATINRVTYGLKPTVRVVFRDGGREQTIDVSDLPEFVTKLTPEAETVASTVQEAIVYYPVPFCRNNVDIIDTPGLNDNPAMTEVTLDVLPRVDAAILVVLATAPFSQTEAVFLEKLLVEYGLGSVVFVVTAIDRLRHRTDRENIVSTVRERIADCIRQHAVKRFGEGTEAFENYLRRVGEPRVFGVSGYDALTGKMDGDEAKLVESRLPEFEEFLERFLTEESGLVVLKTHAERVTTFANSLVRETATRLGSQAPAGEGPLDGAPGALLGHLEWLAQDAKDRLDEQRREAQAHLRSLFQGAPGIMLDAAGKCLADLSASVEDLDPPRLASYLKGWEDKLTEALHAAALRCAYQWLPELRPRIEEGIAGLVRFAVVYDRVMLHARSATPRNEATPHIRPFPAPMVQSLGCTAGFDGTDTEGAVQILFDAYASERKAGLRDALAMTKGWSAGIDIQPMAAAGPNFTRKAMDLIRIEKFKMQLRAKFTETVSQHLQQTWGAREQALDRQVAEAFAFLARQIEQALDEMRAVRAQLLSERQRWIAWEEHERRRIEQVDAEVRGIHERARALARELHALQFKVLPKTASGQAGGS